MTTTRQAKVAEEYVNYITQTYQVDTSDFPKRLVKFHGEDKPFVTGKIKRLMADRDPAYTKGNIQKFKLLRNKVNNEIKKKKQKFYGSKVKPLRSSNPKELWKGIKRICVGYVRAAKSTWLTQNVMNY